MNKLDNKTRAQIVAALVEGNSIRATCRMTGAHIETILKLLVETGQHCHTILDEKMHGIRCEAIELDELWCFIQKKQRRLTDEDRLRHPEYGDTYTFIALDPVTKLVPAFHVGKRDAENTERFIADLSRRIDGPVQLSTDGFKPYIEPIRERFTRLTNGFSRKAENLRAAVSLFFWSWNFCWIPRTTRVTPAMAAGLTNRVWELRELVA